MLTGFSVFASVKLKALEMIFLPPNVTWIIRNFKRKYKKKMLVKDLIKALDRNEKLEVSVLDTINYTDKNWSFISSQTIFQIVSDMQGLQQTPNQKKFSTMKT